MCNYDVNTISFVNEKSFVLSVVWKLGDNTVVE